MPTAFFARYGEGRPVIGILAEFDALPGINNLARPEKRQSIAGAPGHGCGHNLFGAASVGAAVAAKTVLSQQNLPGTIVLFGCPAEETVIGKVYMAKAGVFDGLDLCLDWHPGDVTSSDF
jgi:aminobenzoyl-glutamate utilization protein B